MLVLIEAIDFRNFSCFSIEPSAKFNLIFGANGAGKSSLLEAIYFLSLARSFRTSFNASIISNEKDAATIFGSIKDKNNLMMSVGMKKARNNSFEIHLNGQLIKTSVQLAKTLPVILINPDSYGLIHDGPLARRQFLNWALFHVEQSFFSVWKNFQRCLKQRNTALKSGIALKEIQFWDKEFVQLSLVLDEMYIAYTKALNLETQTILSRLTNINNLSMEYYSGWNKDKYLEDLLKEGFFKEKQYGYTLFGPHRGDLRIKFNGISAGEVLSRGEQKLLIFALQLAQAQLLNKMANLKCIYLIDDIAAELDKGHRKTILDFLASLDAQVFLTCLELEQIPEVPLNDLKVFHVERGSVFSL